ncbi:MAG: DUF4139 domain-containing protein, partial [bacterium]
GKIRVYKRDEDKSLIFIGEDFVNHTPENEKLRVYVGNAFDIVGERIQKDRRTIGKTSWQETWEIKLGNHKGQAVKITVIEHLQTDWEILQHSHDYTKRDAQTIEFEVEIPKDSEMIIDYVVRYNR